MDKVTELKLVKARIMALTKQNRENYDEYLKEKEKANELIKGTGVHQPQTFRSCIATDYVMKDGESSHKAWVWELIKLDFTKDIDKVVNVLEKPISND